MMYHPKKKFRWPSRQMPRDPYDIYWLGDKYPDSERKKNIKYLGPKTLWRLEKGGPRFVA